MAVETLGDWRQTVESMNRRASEEEERPPEPVATNASDADTDLPLSDSARSSEGALTKWMKERLGSRSKFVIIVTFIILDAVLHELESYVVLTDVSSQSMTVMVYLGSFVIAFLVSLAFDGSKALRTIFNYHYLWRWFLIAALLMAQHYIHAVGVLFELSEAWVLMLDYVNVPMALLISLCVFKREYGRLEWLAVSIMTLGMATFVLIRFQCEGDHCTEWRMLWDSNEILGVACITASVFLQAVAWSLAERLLKAKSQGLIRIHGYRCRQHLYIMMVHLSFWALATNFCSWFYHSYRHTWNILDGKVDSPQWFGKWTVWHWLLVTAYVAHLWASGMVIKRFSTVVWALVQIVARVLEYSVSDLLTERVTARARALQTLMIAPIVILSAVIFQTGRLNLNEIRKVLDLREPEPEPAGWRGSLKSMVSPPLHENRSRSNSSGSHLGHRPIVGIQAPRSQTGSLATASDGLPQENKRQPSAGSDTGTSVWCRASTRLTSGTPSELPLPDEPSGNLEVAEEHHLTLCPPHHLSLDSGRGPAHRLDLRAVEVHVLDLDAEELPPAEAEEAEPGPTPTIAPRRVLLPTLLGSSPIAPHGSGKATGRHASAQVECPRQQTPAGGSAPGRLQSDAAPSLQDKSDTRPLPSSPSRSLKEDGRERQSRQSRLLVLAAKYSAVVAYIISQALRENLSQKVCVSRIIVPQSLNVATSFCGLLLAIGTTLFSHGSEGLWNACNLRKFARTLICSLLFAFSAFLGSMAFALGTSAAAKDAAGRVYTPVAALLSRWIMGKFYMWLEWLALIILTLSFITFGLIDVMSNSYNATMAGLLCAVGSGTVSAVNSLVLEKLMKTEPDPYVVQNVRLNLGNLFFSIGFIWVMGIVGEWEEPSRLDFAVWRYRPTTLECSEMGTCSAEGTYLPRPSSAADEVVLEVLAAAYSEGVCFCGKGFFVGWNSTWLVYAALASSVVYSWVTGLVVKQFSSVYRSIADGLMLLLVFFILTPILDQSGFPDNLTKVFVVLIIPLSGTTFSYAASEMQAVMAAELRSMSDGDTEGAQGMESLVADSGDEEAAAGERDAGRRGDRLDAREINI